MRKAVILLTALLLVLSLSAFTWIVTKPPMFVPVSTGYSMYPELQSGDILYGHRPVLPGEIQVGDIVVFEWLGEGGEKVYIVHRVVDIVETFTGNIYYVTQGDYEEGYYPRRVEVGFYGIYMVVDDVVRPGTLEYVFKENAELIAVLSIVAAVFCAAALPRLLRED